MDKLLSEVLEIAQELFDEEQLSAPIPRVAPDEMRQRVDLSLASTGIPVDDVMARMRAVVRVTPRTSSRRFFNQLYAGRLEIASAAEMLTGLLNVSMYTYKIAGPMILIENEIIARMCRFAGFPNGFGIAVPGGSMANLVGMMLGRNRAMPNLRNNGADGRRLTYYLSQEGHYSVVKNAGILGTGRANVRLIATDELGRMRVDALEAAIEKDLEAGAVPCAVIATAGTTVLGEFDPLRAIAAVTQKHGIWLHVDGAYGGTLLLHPAARQKLDGLELADSLTWDAHKLMGIPLMCSMLLTRQRGQLSANFQETADYLFQADDYKLNPGTRSLQCGRRNDAFKLWAAWLNLGDEGWATRIEKQLHMARYAAARVQRETKMTLCQDPASTNVCFSVEGANSKQVCGALHDSGKALIGYGEVRGEQVFRLVTVNGHTEEQDIDRLFDDILAASGL
mgnify:CR=1 FL=1